MVLKKLNLETEHFDGPDILLNPKAFLIELITVLHFFFTQVQVAC